MCKRLWWLVVVAVGASLGVRGPAEASCAGSTISVATTPSVIGGAIPIIWAIDPPCPIIETGLLLGADPTVLAPVGQPIYGDRGVYEQEILVAESGEYWVAAYARDEAGAFLQSPPQSVVVAVPSLPPVGSPGSHGAQPPYTGTDEEFRQPVGQPHFASLRKGDSTGTRIFFANTPNWMGDVERVIASTDRAEVLSEQQEPLVLRDLVFPITPDLISPSLDFQDSRFNALGYPRPGLYIVPCVGFATFGGAIRNSLCQPGGHNPSFPSLNFGYEETDSGGFTGSARSGFTYFIPRPPPGKRVQGATLRAFVVVGRGDSSAIRLSGKSPTAIEVAGHPSNLWVTWDFTEEARGLGPEGGTLALTPDPIPPEILPGFSAANYNLFLNVDYPWLHGAGRVGQLRVTFEEACPQELKVTVDPDTLRPLLPGPSSAIPAPIRSFPTQATVTALVKTCPASPGNPPAPVEVTFTVQPPGPSTPEAGGHAHDTTRPMGSLRDLGSGQEANHCTVQAFDADGMGSCTVPVPYQAPEVSGVETIVATAPGFPAATATARVEVPGLVELPEAPARYVRIGTPDNHAGTNDPCIPETRPPTSRHFEAFFGQPALLKAIEEIAATMLQQTGILLRVNDMSLPLGGLFDIDNNWRTPHFTHRVGRHVDLGFSGLRNTGCTAYNLNRLKEVVLEVTRIVPEIEGDHFHVSVRVP